MKQAYRVLLCRRVIESCAIDVEAESEEGARELALDRAFEGQAVWEDPVTDEIWVEDLNELE